MGIHVAYRELYIKLCAVILFSLAVMYIKKNNYKIITIQCTNGKYCTF